MMFTTVGLSLKNSLNSMTAPAYSPRWSFSTTCARASGDQVAIEEEASAIFGRKVDLVSRKAIERSENYIRR